MVPVRFWIVSTLLFLTFVTAGVAYAENNNAIPIGFETQEYPPEYPTDYPTDYPTITIEPTIDEQYGWVSINSVPSGAAVTFDGSYQGQSPVTVQVMLSQSRFHQIFISMDGYQDWSTSLTELPAPGQTIPVNAYLVPIGPTATPTYTPTWTPVTFTPTPTPTFIGSDYGWVYVDSNPSGAEITFDGVFQGSAPALVKVYTTGTPSHQILARMNGYYDWSYTLSQNPGPDQTIPITADLVPMAQYGSIRVTSNPTKSIAIIDGGNQDLTPCTFNDLIPGSHTIKVTKDGYQPFTSQVRVSAGSQAQVTAQLNQVVNTGTLYVTSSPSGADISLDGVYYGQTPYSLSASAGSHSMSLQLAGYQKWKSGVTVSAGQQTQISAQLEPQGPQYGAIQVASVPGSSSVFLNNDYYGHTPDTGYMDISELSPGTYTIKITHPQNQDYLGTVAVTAGQTSTVNIALPGSPRPATVNGTVILSSNPSGANVFLDNLFMGITPSTLSSVSPGEHTLLLRLTGYTDSTRQISVSGGNTTDVMIDMVPVTPPTLEPTATPTPSELPSYHLLFPLVVIIGIIILVLAVVAIVLYWKRSRT